MAKRLKHLEFTIQELQQFVSDTNSCVKRINNQMHIGFPPWGISNFKETLTGILKRNKIGRYDEKIGGIILDIKNIKVQGNQFMLQNDSADLHINLVADFYVFIPTIGCIIQGTIKHIAPGHISVILYHLFNVTIKIDATQQNLKINSEVLVKITNFNLEYTIPSIHGELYTDPNKIEKSDDPTNVNGTILNESSDSSSSQTDPAKLQHTAVNGTVLNENSDSSSEADSDDENINFKQKIQKQILNAIKIKQEKRSSSEHDESSDSDNGKKPLKASLLKRKIKQEKLDTPSSTSDSDNDSKTSNSSAEEKLNIKMEAKNTNKIKLLNKKRKSSESTSISDDDLLDNKTNTLLTNGHQRKNQKKIKIEPIDKEDSIIGSPLLSSTVYENKINEKSKRKKK